MNRKLFLIALVASLLVLSGCKKSVQPEVIPPSVVTPPSAPIAQPVIPTSVEVVEPDFTEAKARAIAENNCISQGETLEAGYYNPNSRTWWFNAHLSETPEGCNPACVVSEDGTFEINWRCTGLIPEDDLL